MMVTATQILGGVALDLVCGDPRWLPHPTVGIGKLASTFENFWRNAKVSLRLAGVMTWVSLVATICLLVYASISIIPSPWIQIYWIYSLLAMRSLDDHAMAVISSLQAGDIDGARRATGMIVGRDTAELNEAEITRAVFESVAESMNDGIIAPLFWLVVGGPVGMAGYKTVNTLDSMFGYRNERYEEFGWASARMDDIANFIPARITAGLIWIAASFVPGLDAGNSIRATLRDARTQPSPNAGYPEAAVAGALQVQLGGVNFYGGIPSPKAFLGEPLQPLNWRRYGLLRAVVYATAGLFVFLVGGLAARV
jgi:adenosylcobinamide-phosphate synthase